MLCACCSTGRSQCTARVRSTFPYAVNRPRVLPVGTLAGLVGRYFIAVSLNEDGSFRGGNGFWRLGDPCTRCADRPLDPSDVRRELCRNPRGHAWAQMDMWRSSGLPESGMRVLAPRATSYEEARARAIDMCEQIRTVGHL
ncbi:hypothetical protein EF903_05485 [Streptomyces sp. WAC05292]|uniref:hypothetical protein n=1 Tax=Streptomyces sp. WAC05292 TaxID=2487418 RepID=UPI000F737ED0|nr:hypothetical protein [Streptomyces sp. WAC05292]RSS95093.1 hypothetical protein EF903_05485 [Streptomyces sp. WAC05292]